MTTTKMTHCKQDGYTLSSLTEETRLKHLTLETAAAMFFGDFGFFEQSPKNEFEVEILVEPEQSGPNSSLDPSQ